MFKFTFLGAEAVASPAASAVAAFPFARTVRFVFTRFPAASNNPSSLSCTPFELWALLLSFLLLIVKRKYLALVPDVAVTARAAPGLVQTWPQANGTVGAAKSVRTSRSVHVSPSFDPCRRKSRGERHCLLSA